MTRIFLKVLYKTCNNFFRLFSFQGEYIDEAVGGDIEVVESREFGISFVDFTSDDLQLLTLMHRPYKGVEQRFGQSGDNNYRCSGPLDYLREKHHLGIYWRHNYIFTIEFLGDSG